MLKKVLVAGLAVVVGVAVLAWISPPLFDWICHQAKAAKEGMEESIPLEQRIDILKDKLNDLKKNKQKYYDQAAKESVEVEKLSAEVDKESKNLADQWDKIQAIRGDLETQKTSYHYSGHDYTRADVEKELKRDFETYKTAQAALDAKKELLGSRKEALDAAREQLSSLEGLNGEMEARLEQMKAELEKVRMREAKTGTPANDNDYANLKAEMDQVGNKIAEREKALDLKAEFEKGPIDPRADKGADAADILKQIDDYKAQKDAPKPDVAEKK
jgi:chromosome segregation ATPase